MGKEKYNKEELIRLLIHEGKSYKEVAAMRGDGSTGEAILYVKQQIDTG